MDPTAFLLFPMLATSVTLVVTLSIAWLGFGRPQHALTWAIAYGVATAQWALAAAEALAWPGENLLRPVTMATGAVTAGLIAVGFRQRIGAKPHLQALALLTLVCVAATTWMHFTAPNSIADRAILPLFLAFTHIVGISTLIGRGWRSSLAERAMFAALAVFALYQVGLAGLSLTQGLASPAETAAFRDMRLIGTPAGFIVTGLFSVFLLAADLAEKMRRLAFLDPLTGILNRRGLEQAASAAIANSRRAGLPLSVIIADLDRFKQINDTRGHAAGDRALCHFTSHVERAIRKGDLFGRIGGEEFALVLSNTGADTAVDVAERIRAGLADLDMGGDGHRLSSSFGVAMLGENEDFAELAGRADEALYRSKIEGRDRVTLADPVAVPAAGAAGDPPPRRSRRALHL